MRVNIIIRSNNRFLLDASFRRFFFFLVLVNYFLLFVTKVNGGREGRPIGAYELAKAVEELGAGEILLNCIDCDGESNFCTF